MRYHSIVPELISRSGRLFWLGQGRRTGGGSTFHGCFRPAVVKLLEFGQFVARTAPSPFGAVPGTPGAAGQFGCLFTAGAARTRNCTAFFRFLT